MKSTRFLLQVAGLSAILAGCVGTQSGQEVHFLRQKDTDGLQMEAQLEGRLILADGCLRIQIGDGESYTAIWPFEFSLSENDGSVHVLNGEGQVVAQVGDYILVSGGGGNLNMSQEEFEESFIGPYRCPEPYWIVGYEVAVITP